MITLRGKCYLNCTQNHIEQLDIQLITSPKIFLLPKAAYLISIERMISRKNTSLHNSIQLVRLQQVWLAHAEKWKL